MSPVIYYGSYESKSQMTSQFTLQSGESASKLNISYTSSLSSDETLLPIV